MWEEADADPNRRWARPEQPFLHDLADERAEPLVFWHNTNYRISRKYINVEKVKVGRHWRGARTWTRPQTLPRDERPSAIHTRLRCLPDVSTDP